MSLRVLIADDEAPARARVRQFARQEPDVEILGECANGREAIAAIEKDAPDLVFLDVQMPVHGGLEVCRRVTPGRLRMVIFVTAFDQYAVHAFDLHAVDYLLKPFDRERFQRAMERARARLGAIRSGAPDPALVALLQELKDGARPSPRLAFKTNGRVVFVRQEEIDTVEADGNYVKVKCGAAMHHVRETLSWMEKQLPPGRFLRISRSMLVNRDRVRELQPLFYGDHVVILQDGSKHTLSRTYRDTVEKLIAAR